MTQPDTDADRGDAEVRRPARVKRVLGNLALACGSLAVALLLGEAVTRVAAPRAAPQPVGGEGLYVHDTLYGWKKRPGATVTSRTAEFEVTQSVNALGLRGPETTLRKPDGTFRVLLLGDSFLEGYTVGLEDLVSTRLEHRLAASADRPVEVLNAGTAGYSTDQELLYFEQEGRALAPDVTVLLFYVNDVYYNVHGNYWRGAKPYFELSDTGLELRGVPVPAPAPDRFAFEVEGGAGLVGLLRRLDAWLGTRSALHALVRGAVTDSPTLAGMARRLGLADVPGEFRAWRRTPEPAVAQAWEVTEALLERLGREVEAAGSDLVVFYVPSRPAVYADDWRTTRRAYAMDDAEWSPSADGEVLARMCEERGLECIIRVDEYRAEAERAGASGQRLYYELDAHWAPAGHRLAAAILAEALAPRLER